MSRVRLEVAVHDVLGGQGHPLSTEKDARLRSCAVADFPTFVLGRKVDLNPWTRLKVSVGRADN
jgi:hypothetical protein